MRSDFIRDNAFMRPGVLGCLLVVMLSCDRPAAECLAGTCELTAEPAFRLGSINGEDAFVSTMISVSEAGPALFAYDWNDVGHIRRYTERGEFAGLVGRRGPGPGEYHHPSTVFLRDDGRYGVLDSRTFRLTILEPDFRTVVATHQLPAFSSVSNVVPIADGRLVVNGSKFTEASMGLPLHLVSATGSWIRSFGADPAIVGSWDSGAFARAISPGREGSVWSAHRQTYVIERWDTTGTLIDSFSRNVDWFPPVKDRVLYPTSPDTPPTPFILGLHEGDSGYLWVYIVVPRHDWADQLERIPSSEPGPPRYRAKETYQQMYETRIEVVDPDSRKVVATGTIPVGLLQVTTSGRPFALVMENLVPRLEAWHVVLQSSKEVQQ